jgi:hypothetical protein
MTRELKIPVVYESLLGKRLREDWIYVAKLN